MIGMASNGQQASRYTSAQPPVQNGITNVGFTLAVNRDAPVSNPGAVVGAYFDMQLFNDPAPVPTMSEWAMILFGLILAGGAALSVQRRQFSA